MRSRMDAWQAGRVRGCFSDLRSRRLVVQMSDPELGKRLEHETVTAYAGFDPSSDSLHVGHLLGVLCLRRLQDGGHRPLVLAGGGTGLIGDPGGKAEERSMLGPDEIEHNVAGIRGQLERLLDFGTPGMEGGALLLDNREWLEHVGMLDFLREVGKNVTVNQMVAKESVRGRLDAREAGISYTEFSYMLLQAYDYLQLFDRYGCRLQLGGNDQWGNITIGLDLIRRTRGAEAWGLTWPLVVRADGTKMGKTESGAVWLDATRSSPYQLYQYFVRTDDHQVGDFLRYFTFLDHARIEELEGSVRSRPQDREAHKELARQVTALVHGEGEARKAERASAALFGGELSGLDESTVLEVFSEVPSTALPATRLDGGGIGLVDALELAGLDRSKSRARATITQGGAYVNNRRVSHDGYRLSREDQIAGGVVVLRKGQKHYHLLRFR